MVHQYISECMNHKTFAKNMEKSLQVYASYNNSSSFSYRPSNLLLDQNSVDYPTYRAPGDWLDTMQTGQCKDYLSGVSYSSCETIAKISLE